MSANAERAPVLTAPYFHRVWDESDIDELKELGFNGVVFCLREEHLGGLQPHSQMRRVVRYARAIGMETEVDLWSFGNVFGGEGGSEFGPDNPACYVRSNKLHEKLSDGIDYAVKLGAQGMFWDEPHFKDCPDCEGVNETKLLVKYAEQASRSGLTNSVCLTSSQSNMKKLDGLARLPFINQAETDPYYSNYPTETDNPDRYVGGYAEAVKSIGDRYHIPSRIWVQGFSLANGWEDLPYIAAEAAIKKGVRKIGFWVCAHWEKADINRGIPEIVPVNNDLVIAKAALIRNLQEERFSDGYINIGALGS